MFLVPSCLTWNWDHGQRRWNTEPWDQQQERALRDWLLDRLEGYFDFDGSIKTTTTSTQEGNSIPEIPSCLRAFVLKPCLTSVAAVADLNVGGHRRSGRLQDRLLDVAAVRHVVAQTVHHRTQWPGRRPG